nr:hypothetical protein [Aeromonas sp. QDB30]
MNMDVLLAALVEQKGSDLFITVDAPPTLKVNGRLVSLGPAPLDKTTALALIRESLDEYLFTRTGLTASVLPGWDNLSSRCTP